MVRHALAIRKGMSAEYLAKAFFSKNGYLIITPDTHETSYDFIAVDQNGNSDRVQVKAVNELKSGLARIRNKHGSTNRLYLKNSYDILAGVWVERSKIYLFNSEDVNENEFGEAITVERLDGRKLDSKRRPEPYFQGNI